MPTLKHFETTVVYYSAYELLYLEKADDEWNTKT
jgi:hypothetical protein